MAKKEDEKEVTKFPNIRLKHLLPYLFIFLVAPFLTFAVGRLTDLALGFSKQPSFPLNLLFGSCVFSLGLYIGIKSARSLYRIGKGLPWGDINHRSESTSLVTEGPYAYCRNPMTIGYSLLPCGMGIIFQSLGMTIIVPVIILIIMIPLLKIREEPKLKKRFGSSYTKYKARTPFLIPQFKTLILNTLKHDSVKNSNNEVSNRKTDSVI